MKRKKAGGIYKIFEFIAANPKHARAGIVQKLCSVSINTILVTELLITVKVSQNLNLM